MESFINDLNQSLSPKARRVFDAAYLTLEATTDEVVEDLDRQKKGHDVIISRGSFAFSVDEKWVKSSTEKFDFPIELGHSSPSGERPSYLDDARHEPHLIAYGMSWNRDWKVYLFNSLYMKRVYRLNRDKWLQMYPRFEKHSRFHNSVWSTTAMYVPIEPALSQALICTVRNGQVSMNPLLEPPQAHPA